MMTSTPLSRSLARAAARLDSLDSPLRERTARARVAARPELVQIDIGDAVVRCRIEGAGPTLVFCVDPPVVVEQYDRLVHALSNDFRVIVFEPPGFGFSVARPGFDPSFAGMTHATARLLRALGHAPYTLVFPCVSAFTALDVAHRYPGLVERLVLTQAPSWDEELKWKARRDPKGLLATPVVGQMAMRLLARRRAPAWFDAAVGDRARTPELKATTDRALRHGAQFGLATAFQSYLVPGVAPPPATRPTLVVWGEADRSHARTDRSSSRSLADDLTVVTAPEVGHFPELERPEWFAGLLRSFVGQRRSAA
jgi:pimeloyl-ACP methyl ester carboxylesterase